ncbi:MAG: NAD(P)-binding protein [Planctomycetota bacterium]|jgi:hypothetical protein
MNISVIGGGWSGLVVARMLTDRGHEVALYHDQPALGGMLHVGELHGVPVDMGPHIFHDPPGFVWDWVGRHVAAWHDVKGYTGQVVLKRGRPVRFPPSMCDDDILKFRPVKSDHPPTTLKELIWQKYGKRVWKLIYAKYTRRLWKTRDIKLWKFIGLADGEIPQGAQVFGANERVAYPVGGWRRVVNTIWPRPWTSGLVSQESLDDEIVIDTSPLLPLSSWRPATFTAHVSLDMGCGVRYDNRHGHPLREIDQSLIAGAHHGGSLRRVRVAQDLKPIHYSPPVLTVQTDHAYPRPGLDGQVNSAWAMLPAHVWPFGRGGLHVYDNMAHVVRGARVLAEWINDGTEKTQDRLAHLRGILGGWA